MYLARFVTGEAGFLTAAFQWPAPEGALVPGDWRRELLAQTELDLALRVVTEAGSSQALLLLSADVAAEADLGARCDRLLRTHKPSGLVVPSNAAEFDTLTGQVPHFQIRVNHDGYHHNGEPLACDFRLYSVFAARRDTALAAYQVHLRAHRPDAEVERRVRKYIARLDLEMPFTEPVRAMQRALAQRLCRRGWLANEYLFVRDRGSLDRWLNQIRVHFKETTGLIGFPEPPVETGDFSDWLTTGCHPSRGTEVLTSLPCQAASVLSEDESALLFAASFVRLPGGGAASGSTQSRPQVFISYASGDVAHAFATCRQLEENGLPCWIAPRDIDRDILPYPEAIQRGLSQARAVVVLISDTANLSIHIPRELDLALERKLVIVPVRLQEVIPGGQLNYLLRTCQWLDAYNRNFDDAMQELLKRLRSILD